MTKAPHVLVTGVAGFIGSHVAANCLKQRFRVTGVDDLSGGNLQNVPKGVEFVHGNLCHKEFVKSLWDNKKYDYVYHLAAYAAEGLSHFIRRYNYEVNLLASIHLINQSVLNEVKCFVFTSSIAVYGPGQTPMSEDMVPRPEDPYGISKYAVELDLDAAHRMFGLNYVIFRPHNVYGEHQNIADRYRNVIGIFMNQVMNGKPMSVFGDGMQTRAFSHVDDVAPIISRAPLIPASYQQTFNVGADKPYSILELAEEIARAFNISPKIVHLEPRKEVINAFADHRKVFECFSPPPPLSLTEGIARMSRWARSQGPMQPVEFSDIEVSINLPPSWLSKRP